MPRSARTIVSGRVGREERRARRRRVLEQRRRSANGPYKIGLSERQPVANTLGPFDNDCNFCGARFFEWERLHSHSFCCQNGKISLFPIRQSQIVVDFLCKNDDASLNYKANILKYNAAHAMVSTSANVEANARGGPYMYKINGQVHHRIGCMRADDASAARYLQLYFYDTEMSSCLRESIDANEGCDSGVMRTLAQHLSDVNPYVKMFRSVSEVFSNTPEDKIKEIRMVIFSDRDEDKRRYNLPTASDVAAIFNVEDGCPIGERDVIVYPIGSHMVNLDSSNSALDPLAYPLLFPYGDEGWHRGMQHLTAYSSSVRKKTTQLEYASFRLSCRSGFSTLHSSQKLFLQWVCDMYVRVECERLLFIRSHQQKLRAELYFNLHDAVRSRAIEQGVSLGRMVILPKSFSGSYRNLHANFLDAMAIVQKCGKPDLFITFTCNPNWKEITENLGEGEKSNFRPDLVSRVFHAKLKSLINHIRNEQIFGRVEALIYTIEFQKRGLPHAHILVTLSPEDKVHDAETIDRIVSAEIPNATEEPELYDLVKKHMIHGPCGELNSSSVCMRDGACSKGFPKPFCDSTRCNVNGYPIYRRMNDGSFIDVRGVTVDNRFVVPFNPFLLMKYQAHINVEICTTVKSIKYIYKYIYKGFDAANIEFRNCTMHYDEVTGYLNARWVGSGEACWRLFKFEMHFQSHAVISLECHEENLQRVVFRDGEEEAALDPKDTKLMAWFKLNETDPNANHLLYTEVPYHYTWNSSKSWRPRERCTKPIVTRINAVSPKKAELFHLRLLLFHARGAKSFADLKTVNGVLYPTFREAAIALGITTSSQQFVNTMNEAASYASPSKVREVFAISLALNCPPDAPDLWASFKHFMSEDFISAGKSIHEAENQALLDIEEILVSHNTDCESLNLPIPVRGTQPNESTDCSRSQWEFNERYLLLNAEQKSICDQIIQALNIPTVAPKMFFLQAPGGCGKTFVQETLISYCYSVNKLPIPVAFSGIAASLITGGRTIHSQFKIPIMLNESSVSAINPGSSHARFLNSAALIIWDEASMTPSTALTVVDRLFKDITTQHHLKTLPFAGKVVLFSGDFRQTLPVVPHSGRAETIEHCIKNNHLWPFIKQLTLSTNMRIREGENEFADFLLKVGTDTLPKDKEGRSLMDQRLLGTGNPIDFVYKNLSTDLDNETIQEKCILAPTNKDCAIINDQVLERIEGDATEYLSVDTIRSDDTEDGLLLPPEFLNSLEVSGLPRHRLRLKKGTVVLLIRNINVRKGLINGTRLKVMNLLNHCIDCTILTGSSRGERVLIPRVILTPAQNVLPFKMERFQFPLLIAFAMSINKSQGQSLNKVAIYLPTDVFSHGQLYVALSRCRTMEGVRIFLPEAIPRTPFALKNVVYHEVL